MFKKTTALAALLGLLGSSSAFGSVTYSFTNNTNQNLYVNWGINVGGLDFGSTHFYCAKDPFTQKRVPTGAQGECGAQMVAAGQSKDFFFTDVACMTPETFQVGPEKNKMQSVEIKSLPNEARDKMDNAVDTAGKSVSKAGKAAGESGIKQAKIAESAGKIISQTIKGASAVSKASTCKTLRITIVNAYDDNGQIIPNKYYAYTFGIR